MKEGQQRLFFLLIIASFLQMLYFWPLMPDSMVSHFDGAGRANGWEPRTFFFIVYAGLMALLIVIFQILPRQLKRLPDSLINLPNKGFWFAPERREATLGIIGKQMTSFGNATMILIIVTMQLVFQANRAGSHRISAEAMWIMLGAYILVSIVWAIDFIRKFKKPQVHK